MEKDLKEICEEILKEVKERYKNEKKVNIYQESLKRDAKYKSNEEQRNLIINNIFEAQTTKYYLCINFLSLDILQSLYDEDLISLYYHYFAQNKDMKILIK